MAPLSMTSPTSNNHPITPPPELVREWAKTCSPYEVPADHIATEAARWGADQELEACCADLRMVLGPDQAAWLGSVRRPKPPSLKDQALDAWIRLRNEAWCEEVDGDLDCVLRDLESLPD